MATLSASKAPSYRSDQGDPWSATAHTSRSNHEASSSDSEDDGVISAFEPHTFRDGIDTTERW